MKRYTTITAVVVVSGIMIAAGYYVASRTTPTTPSQQEQEGAVMDEVRYGAYADYIQVQLPEAGSIATSPMNIVGEARGTWYFEASFPIVLQDDNGFVIAQHYAQAQSDWMTEEFVPFISRIVFDPSEATADTGVLILKKDNPSGLAENDAQIEVPVRFK